MKSSVADDAYGGAVLILFLLPVSIAVAALLEHCR